MALTETTCFIVTCDVCSAPLDGLDAEDVPIHWGNDYSARTHARDEGWTLAPDGKAVSYGPQLIVDMAVCDASDADHHAARKLILTGGAS